MNTMRAGRLVLTTSLSSDDKTLRKNCDSSGCEAHATGCCSHHGLHLCEAHLRAHRETAHAIKWSPLIVIGLA